MEGQRDSLWPLQQLVKTWSNGARDEESGSSRRSKTSHGAEGAPSLTSGTLAIGRIAGQCADRDLPFWN